MWENHAAVRMNWFDRSATTTPQKPDVKQRFRCISLHLNSKLSREAWCLELYRVYGNRFTPYYIGVIAQMVNSGCALYSGITEVPGRGDVITRKAMSDRLDDSDLTYNPEVDDST
uniref:SFRICE_002029 n=1 Tax=Spodoptera frugiperda TaxID=7108 RepID=A0A2H1WIW6_SPOFR